MFYSVNFIHILSVIIFCNTLCHATLTQDNKFIHNRLEPKEPTSVNVFDRGLVVSNPKVRDVLREYKSYTESEINIRHFNGSVLVYVTPWHNYGYNLSVLFAAKITHVSPVWFQLKIKDDIPYIDGEHNIDESWMEDLRKGGVKKIVPRVMIEGWNSDNIMALLVDNHMPGLVGSLMAQLAQKYDFDGFVLETWSAFGIQQKESAAQVISKIHTQLKKFKLLLILVIPPPLYYGGRKGFFLKEDIERLAPYVQGFSLMTYDYSNPQRPGPNGPLKWLRECVQLLVPKATSPIRKKILMGLNMYGNDYSPVGGEAIVGDQYIKILSQFKPQLIWDDYSYEHYSEYKKGSNRNRVFYPTLYSINERIKLARELGIGLSVWEIGQSLPYFWDLF